MIRWFLCAGLILPSTFIWAAIFHIEHFLHTDSSLDHLIFGFGTDLYFSGIGLGLALLFYFPLMAWPGNSAICPFRRIQNGVFPVVLFIYCLYYFLAGIRYNGCLASQFEARRSLGPRSLGPRTILENPPAGCLDWTFPSAPLYVAMILLFLLALFSSISLALASRRARSAAKWPASAPPSPTAARRSLAE